MKIFLRVILFSIIILLTVFLLKPELLNKIMFFKQKNNTINPYHYTLTPDPSKFFIVNLKISSSPNYNFSTIASALNLYFTSLDSFNKNIIELLSNSTSKKVVLGTYIRELENLKDRIDDMILTLNDLIVQENLDYQTYYTEKKVGDEQFRNGFIEKSTDISIEGLNISYLNAPKYIKHRVVMNSTKIVLYKIQYLKTLLDAKLLLLTNNEDKILSNFDLIKGNLLRELLSLKYKLENNKFN